VSSGGYDWIRDWYHTGFTYTPNQRTFRFELWLILKSDTDKICVQNIGVEDSKHTKTSRKSLTGTNNIHLDNKNPISCWTSTYCRPVVVNTEISFVIHLQHIPIKNASSRWLVRTKSTGEKDLSEISLVGLQSAIYPPWIRIQCQVSKDTEPETIMLVNFEHKAIGYHLIQNIEGHCKYLVKLSFKAGHIICVSLRGEFRWNMYQSMKDYHHWKNYPCAL
jgi:hypothetical protein